MWILKRKFLQKNNMEVPMDSGKKTEIETLQEMRCFKDKKKLEEVLEDNLMELILKPTMMLTQQVIQVRLIEVASLRCSLGGDSGPNRS